MNCRKIEIAGVVFSKAGNKVSRNYVPAGNTIDGLARVVFGGLLVTNSEDRSPNIGCLDFHFSEYNRRQYAGKRIKTKTQAAMWIGCSSEFFVSVPFQIYAENLDMIVHESRKIWDIIVPTIRAFNSYSELENAEQVLETLMANQEYRDNLYKEGRILKKYSVSFQPEPKRSSK